MCVPAWMIAARDECRCEKQGAAFFNGADLNIRDGPLQAELIRKAMKKPACFLSGENYAGLVVH